MGMTTPAPLCWTLLPVPDALARLPQCGLVPPAAEEVLGDWMALLQPTDQANTILAWREVGEPLMLEALHADAGPGSAARLAQVLRDAAGDWWRTAHAWTAFSRWDPNDAPDWSRWLMDCPVPDDDRLARLLAPSRGWLLWDFQWMAVLVGAGVAWDDADALRRAWNLQRPGIERQIAGIWIHGVPLEHVLLRRTLAPSRITSRVDAWTVQRLVEWAVGSSGTRHERANLTSNEAIGFTLTASEAARVEAWAGELSAAMQDEAIEFPGIEFVLGVGPFGEMLEARIGGRCLGIR
jgi:hypothetical protein